MFDTRNPEHGRDEEVAGSSRQATSREFRWKLAEEDKDALFSAEEVLERHVGTGEFRGTEFLHVNARSVINAVPRSSQMPFRHTINVYRGCSHACVYCFARPTHAYLNLNIAEDFEHKIVVKINAVERLHSELASKRWRHESIAMGTNTDPYQQAEGKYHLTQGVIRELVAARNPFSILTKSTLILRDLPLLLEAAATTEVHISVSIGTLDREVWKLTEPGTPPPDKRLSVVAKLAEAGIGCGVLIAPILPGISDEEGQIEAVARACIEAGASSITALGLHLRSGVKEHYLDWLGDAKPELVGLYAERFKRGAYQAPHQRERIERVLRRVMADTGFVPEHERSWRVPHPSSAPLRPAGEQLRML